MVFNWRQNVLKLENLIKLPHRLNVPLQSTISGSQFCIQPGFFPGKPCKIRNIRKLVQMNGSIAFLTVKRDMNFIVEATLRTKERGDANVCYIFGACPDRYLLGSPC